MKLEFNRNFDARKDDVMSTMLDPAVLARIIPGVEEFNVINGDTFEVRLNLGLPAVSGEYQGHMAIRDKVVIADGPSRYVLEGSGSGSQGWVKGSADIELLDAEPGTYLSVSASVQVGGRIAGIGQRMINGVAKSLAEEFFAGFERELLGKRRESVNPITFMINTTFRFFRQLFNRHAPKQST